ncbi:Para-hydroxybenzoate--polyprenyltransferase, mitochondrial precursor (PHB:polyprenyltransferase) [Varicellaria rhodocarpa]|nr:Para-hydroxybenzoate--polyprenyltransferase, mitochondrial precursor (PHB:polyprenyltransferase) [Varicellaria rhodocarpa]
MSLISLSHAPKYLWRVRSYMVINKEPKTRTSTRLALVTLSAFRGRPLKNSTLFQNTFNPDLHLQQRCSFLKLAPLASSISTSEFSNHVSPKSPLTYQPPKTGFISALPASWIPYAELIRLDKPTGTYYLFFPCLFSTLMAASYTSASATSALTIASLFFTGALIMRGAGCSINDLWDRNLDPHVARTKLRPIARGALSAPNAIVYTCFQLLAGLGILVQFPTPCLYYGIPSLLLVGTYPLAKRITHYPQFVLGLTFSWGAFMGFPALGTDLIADPTAATSAALLYASCISWTVLYDMIYAHMDIKDDAKVGIKSIALRHEKDTKTVLSGLAMTQIGFLAAAGLNLGLGPFFFVGSCGSAVVTLGTMIYRVRLKDVSNCWWWFKNGAWFTGGCISLGLLADYMVTDHVSDTTTFMDFKQKP